MKLAEIFSLLANGEMSQLYTGLQNEFGVDEKHQRQIGGSVQLALTALYTRFNLKQSHIELRLVPGKVEYKLQSRYADSSNNTAESVRWIADTTATRFRDDILSIGRVMTPIGMELGINNAEDQYSCYTPTMDTLRVPQVMTNPTPGMPDFLKVQSLRIEYKANHPLIMPRVDLFDVVDLSMAEIELPHSHLQALLYFVASRVSNPVGMGQEFNSGNQWYAKYEMECKRLETAGLDIDTDNTPSRLYQKGFV